MNLPHSDQLERAVLGSMIVDHNLIDTIAGILHAHDFHSDAHHRIFRLLLAIQQRGDAIDAELLVGELRARGEINDVGGVAYLAEVVSAAPVPKHGPYYAEQVLSLSRRRQAIRHGQRLIEEALHGEAHDAPTALGDRQRAPFDLEYLRRTARAEARIFAVGGTKREIDDELARIAREMPSDDLDLDLAETVAEIVEAFPGAVSTDRQLIRAVVIEEVASSRRLATVEALEALAAELEGGMRRLTTKAKERPLVTVVASTEGAL